MKHFIGISIIVLSVLFLNSCATIINGTSQQINITSTPIDAKVTVDDHEVGKTPFIADLKRKDNHIVKIELEGYKTEVITLNGIIGMAIDAVTGGMYKLEPKEINKALEKDNQQSINDTDMLYIKFVLEPDPKWEKIGQLKKL